MPNRKTKQNSERSERDGLLDTYILKVRFKDHKTWRISANNRNLDKLKNSLKELPDNLEKYQIDVMDGKTGEITKFEEK